MSSGQSAERWLHAGGEVVAHLQHEVGPADTRHNAGREEARVVSSPEKAPAPPLVRSDKYFVSVSTCNPN